MKRDFGGNNSILMQKQRNVLPARNESQVFSHSEWIQTKPDGPDMYYAIWKPTGRAVVVRGPYATVNHHHQASLIKFRLDLNLQKERFCGVNPLPWMTGKWLVPDFEIKTPGSCRDCIEGRRTYPFLIMTDLTHPSRKGACNLKEEEARHQSRVKPVCLQDLIRHRNPKARLNFLVAVLFLHVWCIPNTHYKDLMWDPTTCRFWSLGEAMPDITIDTRDLFGQALQESDRRIMAQILIDHWAEVRDHYVVEWLKLPNLPISTNLAIRVVCGKPLKAMVALI